MTPPTSVQTVTAEDLLDRLQNPLWVHSTAPFESPQLSKEETLVDLLSAASEIATLTSSLTAAEARVRELEKLLQFLHAQTIVPNNSGEITAWAALLYSRLTTIHNATIKAALSQTEEGRPVDLILKDGRACQVYPEVDDSWICPRCKWRGFDQNKRPCISSQHAMSEPSRSELLDGLIQDAISVLHHDTTDGDAVDKYERDVLRKKFSARLAAKPERERVIEFALQPFIDGLSGTEAAKMIDKRYPGLSPIQIVVTKFQYQAAKDALKGTPA